MPQGRFREDLYYRLATLPLSVPPLKDRPEDLPVLIDHYLTEAGVQTGKSRRLSEQVRDLFLAYDYPGNVRELINLLNHAVAVSRRHLVDLDDLPPAVLDKLIGRWPAARVWLGTLEGLPLRAEIRLPVARLLTNHAGGFITNADLRRVLNCSDSTAKTILKRLVEAGVAASEGEHRGRRYLIANTPPGDD
jgi:DNA-binding NtrC family response regulator